MQAGNEPQWDLQEVRKKYIYYTHTHCIYVSVYATTQALKGAVHDV